MIGGPLDDGGEGAAWVFTRSGTAWDQQGGKLTGSGETGNGRFGWNVALAADGSTALIGGPIDGDGKGAAWVFTRSGAAWDQQGGKLTGGGESGDGAFGFIVALTADGSTALIGGPYDGGNKGAAWVFGSAPAAAPGASPGSAPTTTTTTPTTTTTTTSPRHCHRERDRRPDRLGDRAAAREATHPRHPHPRVAACQSAAGAAREKDGEAEEDIHGQGRPQRTEGPDPVRPEEGHLQGEDHPHRPERPERGLHDDRAGARLSDARVARDSGAGEVLAAKGRCTVSPPKEHLIRRPLPDRER